MPSMPSVPLIRARPSFSRQLDRRDPGLGERLAGRADRAVRAVGDALAHQGQRAVRQRGQVARAAEAAELVHDRRDPARSAARRRSRRSPRGRRSARWPGSSAGAASAPGRPRVSTCGPDPGRVAADQAEPGAGPAAGRDVPGGQRAEAGRDAVMRSRLVGERVDPGPGAGHLGEGVLGELDPGVAAGDRDHIGRATLALPTTTVPPATFSSTTLCISICVMRTNEWLYDNRPAGYDELHLARTPLSRESPPWPGSPNAVVRSVSRGRNAAPDRTASRPRSRWRSGSTAPR